MIICAMVKSAIIYDRVVYIKRYSVTVCLFWSEVLYANISVNCHWFIAVYNY